MQLMAGLVWPNLSHTACRLNPQQGHNTILFPDPTKEERRGSAQFLNYQLASFSHSFHSRAAPTTLFLIVHSMQNEQTIHKLGGDQLKFVNKAIHKKCIARFHWRGGKRHIRPPLNVSAITTIKCIQCWCKCSNTHVHVFMSTFNDNPLCSVHKKISSRRTVFYPNFHQHELPYIILLKWPKGTSDVPL